MSDPSRPHWFPETEEEFGYYLARLLEGDGHFGDLRVVITFHSDDSSSADYLQRRFGYGSVYEIPDENTVAFVVRKLDVIEKILRLINGKFRGPAKVEQLKQYGYDKKFGLTILPPAEFSILNNHWLAGFVDADGHFGIRARKVKSEGKIVGKQYPDLRQASAQFNVSQKRRLLLDLLYGAFGGGVYYAATTDCYQYWVARLSAVLKVEKYFNKYPLPQRKQVSKLPALAAGSGPYSAWGIFVRHGLSRNLRSKSVA